VGGWEVQKARRNTSNRSAVPERLKGRTKKEGTGHPTPARESSNKEIIQGKVRKSTSGGRKRDTNNKKWKIREK